MTSIWSLALRAEISVRIYYRVHRAGFCRVLCLERVERFVSDP